MAVNLMKAKAIRTQLKVLSRVVLPIHKNFYSLYCRSDLKTRIQKGGGKGEEGKNDNVG